MSSDVPTLPPRKKLSILWWIAALLLLVAVVFLFQLFGPNPRIVISPQTTRVTQPLRPSGLPDYEQHILKMYREGVTPENNAAVLLAQAIWSQELDPQDFTAVAAELGLERLPPEGDILSPYGGDAMEQQVGEWLLKLEDAPSLAENQVAVTDGSAVATIEKIFERATERPWTSEQIPPLAKEISEHPREFELILEASRRPRFYSPSPSLLDSKSDPITEIMLPGQQSARGVGRWLSARAMWHLGEGRVEEAWKDILATHRLARLVAQGHTLVEQLIGLAISNMACERTVTLLHHGRVSPELAERIKRNLAGLPPVSSMANVLDNMERAMYLDVVTRIGAKDFGDSMDVTGFGNQATYLQLLSVDWNIVVRQGNEFCDRLVAAARLPSGSARMGAISKIEADLKKLRVEFQEPGTLAGSLVSRARRSELVAAVMVSAMLPRLLIGADAEDRGHELLTLTRVAALLAVYRATNGNYPQQLADLVPATAGSLPVDLYNAMPFVYLRNGEGYLLYSTGENGADDGGTHERMQVLKGRRLSELDDDEAEKLRANLPAGSDDISIRVPDPPFEMPKLPTSTDEP